jgi:hypothetical protein
MKAIIQGKRYDTEKAIEIGSASDRHHGDFQWFEASLYRTPRSGVFFLAGKGGAMTRFSRKVDQNSWSGGSGIHPMTQAEALEWAEQYLSAEEIEAGFAADIVDA